MKGYLYLIIVSLFIFTACDVHEWPKEESPIEPEKQIIHVGLDFQTELDEQEFFYETRAVSMVEDYEMRYTLRAFPVNTEIGGRVVSRTAVWEYTFTREVSMNDYDVTMDFEIDLPSGEYQLMVWSDFVRKGTSSNHFYAPDDFAEITLYGEHKGSTDMRDAFHGIEAITFVEDKLTENSILIEMERPLAKFTFLSTDLQEFIDKEEAAARARSEARGESYTRGVNLEDYKVVFHYMGFMPCAYNMFTTKPNDSKTGVTFESAVKVVGQSEATMGFDYVFVNGTESSVSIILELYNKDGEELFVSNPIEVPVKRNQHTLMKGKFLTIDTQGGVGISSDFEGEYNYEVKY